MLLRGLVSNINLEKEKGRTFMSKSNDFSNKLIGFLKEKNLWVDCEVYVNLKKEIISHDYRNEEIDKVKQHDMDYQFGFLPNDYIVLVCGESLSSEMNGCGFHGWDIREKIGNLAVEYGLRMECERYYMFYFYTE